MPPKPRIFHLGKIVWHTGHEVAGLHVEEGRDVYDEGKDGD